MRLLLLGLIAMAAEAAQSVQGTVIDSVTGAGIASANVSVEGSSKSVRQAICDASGSFRIDDVPNGDYHAVARATGYVGARLNTEVRRDFRVLGAAVKFDLKLVPAARLSGRVMLADNVPVSGAEVSLTIAGDLVEQTTKSDASGAFEFARVSPGTYTLSASPPSSLAAPAPVGEEIRGWARTFYPGVTDSGSAAKLVVRAGWRLDGQDVRLRPAAMHRMRGTVTNAKGEPAPGARVAFVSDTDVHAKETAAVSTADGTFESPPLFAGGWRLSAFLDQGGTKLKAFDWTRLADHDLEGLRLRLGEPFSVEGVVDMPGKSDHPGGCFLLAPEAGGSGDEIGTACAGASHFQFTNVYARGYRIEPLVFPSDDLYLAAVTIGDRDVLGQIAEFQLGSAPIRITFKSSGGTLQGAVKDCGGAVVVAVPQEAALRKSNYYRVIRRTTCGESGAFRFTRMRPGQYYVFAFDGDDPVPGEFRDLDQYLINLGVTANVRESETENVELHVVARVQ